MSISIEALAMAGVDYNEWGMDIEEYERRETDPPHLWVDDYIEYENEGEDDVEDGEALMMATDEAIDEICGSRAVEIHLEDVFEERNKDDNDDDFGKWSPIAYNKFLNHDHGIKRLTILVVVMIGGGGGGGSILAALREEDEDMRWCLGRKLDLHGVISMFYGEVKKVVNGL
nr:prostatic spermine-binding protein [Tanacetum cinerariifolium]